MPAQGDRVQLLSTGADGCLQSGEVGEIVMQAVGSRPYLVRGPLAELSWYAADDVNPVAPKTPLTTKSDREACNGGWPTFDEERDPPPPDDAGERVEESGEGERSRPTDVAPAGDAGQIGETVRPEAHGGADSRSEPEVHQRRGSDHVLVPAHKDDAERPENEDDAERNGERDPIGWRAGWHDARRRDTARTYDQITAETGGERSQGGGDADQIGETVQPEAHGDSDTSTRRAGEPEVHPRRGSDHVLVPAHKDDAERPENEDDAERNGKGDPSGGWRAGRHDARRRDTARIYHQIAAETGGERWEGGGQGTPPAVGVISPEPSTEIFLVAPFDTGLAPTIRIQAASTRYDDDTVEDQLDGTLGNALPALMSSVRMPHLTDETPSPTGGANPPPEAAATPACPDSPGNEDTSASTSRKPSLPPDTRRGSPASTRRSSSGCGSEATAGAGGETPRSGSGPPKGWFGLRSNSTQPSRGQLLDSPGRGGDAGAGRRASTQTAGGSPRRPAGLSALRNAVKTVVAARQVHQLFAAGGERRGSSARRLSDRGTMALACKKAEAARAAEAEFEQNLAAHNQQLATTLARLDEVERALDDDPADPSPYVEEKQKLLRTVGLARSVEETLRARHEDHRRKHSLTEEERALVEEAEASGPQRGFGSLSSSSAKRPAFRDRMRQQRDLLVNRKLDKAARDKLSAVRAFNDARNRETTSIQESIGKYEKELSNKESQTKGREQLAKLMVSKLKRHLSDLETEWEKSAPVLTTEEEGRLKEAELREQENETRANKQKEELRLMVEAKNKYASRQNTRQGEKLNIQKHKPVIRVKTLLRQYAEVHFQHANKCLRAEKKAVEHCLQRCGLLAGVVYDADDVISILLAKEGLEAQMTQLEAEEKRIQQEHNAIVGLAELDKEERVISRNMKAMTQHASAGTRQVDQFTAFLQQASVGVVQRRDGVNAAEPAADAPAKKPRYKNAKDTALVPLPKRPEKRVKAPAAAWVRLLRGQLVAFYESEEKVAVPKDADKTGETEELLYPWETPQGSTWDIAEETVPLLVSIADRWAFEILVPLIAVAGAVVCSRSAPTRAPKVKKLKVPPWLLAMVVEAAVVSCGVLIVAASSREHPRVEARPEIRALPSFGFASFSRRRDGAGSPRSEMLRGESSDELSNTFASLSRTKRSFRYRDNSFGTAVGTVCSETGLDAEASSASDSSCAAPRRFARADTFLDTDPHPSRCITQLRRHLSPSQPNSYQLRIVPGYWSCPKQHGIPGKSSTSKPKAHPDPLGFRGKSVAAVFTGCAAKSPAPADSRSRRQQLQQQQKKKEKAKAARRGKRHKPEAAPRIDPRAFFCAAAAPSPCSEGAAAGEVAAGPARRPKRTARANDDALSLESVDEPREVQYRDTMLTAYDWYGSKS
ncbi:hypothetical protein DIPPA_16497 [Diplonema papillatum]|nr:hypothetical protein DIPPA_16497 [Diplonema papillatum]